MSILDSVLNSLSHIPDAPRATREYFQEHSLNDAFELSAANLDRYFQGHPHLDSDWQALTGPVLSAGQLVCNLPVGLKDFLQKMTERSQHVHFVMRPLYQVGLAAYLTVHGLLEGGAFVWDEMKRFPSVVEGDSFSIGRWTTMTLGTAGLLWMGAESFGRGGGNFFNASSTIIRNISRRSLSPVSATVTVAGVQAAFLASGLPDLGMSVCMMSASRPAGNNDSASIVAPPDREFVTVPARDFIQGSQIPESAINAVPLRRVHLSPLRILKTVVTNGLWWNYVELFGGRPWAIIGRISEESANVNERGRWGVLRRGVSQAELREWLADSTNMNYASRYEQGLGRRLVGDDRRFFEIESLEIHEVIPADALKHAEGFNHQDQPVVGIINWPRAVAAADGMGRMMTRRPVYYDPTREMNAYQRVLIEYDRRRADEARPIEDIRTSLDDASPGYLLTEAEWEGAARGPLEAITVPLNKLEIVITGRLHPNGRGTISLRENFVEIINPRTMEFGTQVFTDPNHPMVLDWLRNGVLGGWNVFAGDVQQNIWSSVLESRNTTRSVFEEFENGFGLRGMSGNIWQWVDDRRDLAGEGFGIYELPAYNFGEAIQNPRGPISGDTRIVRGGSFKISDPTCLRTAYRGDQFSHGRSSEIGFRFTVFPEE